MNRHEIWFIALKISNLSKIKLIEKYNNEENIYNNIDNIINDKLLYKNFLARLSEKNSIEEEKLEEYLFKNNIKYVTYSSNNYPKKLRNITNPPYVLFYKGDIELLIIIWLPLSVLEKYYLRRTSYKAYSIRVI